MREILMIRYGEIYLKGLNRPHFLRMLLDRVRKAARPHAQEVWLHDGRVYVAGATDTLACVEAVRRVFGVHSIALAVEMEKGDMEAIVRQAVQLMTPLKGTFKVNARRADKLFPMDSPQLNAMLGAKILENCPALSVNVKTPDHVLGVEIRDKAYLYVQIIPAVGGMPVGSNGKATLLLSAGIDSPVAGYMIAKRGVRLNAVHFFSFPYTGERSKEKVLALARILAGYTDGIRVHVVPFTDIQMRIHEKCPEDYTTLIMRRYMMRIAEAIARKENSQALITGESIGQVASQTMEALACTDSVVSLPVFRPVIGFDKADIVTMAKEIGTYETSILPYEDCCTVFTPRHPVTKPRLDRTQQAENRILEEEQSTLIQAALGAVEVVEV